MIVSDAVACNVSAEFSITESATALSVTGTTTEVLCFGEATGAINLNVTGGTAPYSYLWSNGSTNQNLTDLVAGIYSVTVSDAVGCSFTAEFSVREPDAALSSSGETTDVNCFGSATGAIMLTVQGGTAPYEYFWSNGSTSQNQANLVAGTYNVTVRDAFACSVSAEFIITEPTEALLVTGSSTDASCSGEFTGTISLSVQGGTSPYSYEWSNGSTGPYQTDLAAGTYSVIVSDALGCTSIWSTTVHMLSKASISGNLSYSEGFVDAEDATVYLMDASAPGQKAIASVRTQESGFFQFMDIPEGNYYIKAKIDNHGGDNKKYQGVIPSYYNLTHKWKDAEIFQLSCADNESIDLAMYENPSAGNGNGKISGSCNLKDNSGAKAVYYAIPDADVILIDNVSGLPVAYASTTADGLYEISGIPNGDYTLYVDITGITQTDTYQISISDNELVHEDLDFEVDLYYDLIVYTIDNSVDIGDMETEQFELTAYPNPARNFVKLRSELFENQDIKTTMVSTSGALIKVQTFKPVEIFNHEIEFNFPIVSPGSYVIIVQVGEIQQVKNIIVVQ